MNWTRRWVLAGLGAAWMRPVGAKDDLVAAARLGGAVSYAVISAKTGKVLALRDGARAMPPASVTKVVTTLFALDRLGADHRFVTRVLMVGSVQDGVLDGDLILAGGGDPTLDTDRLGDLAAAMAGLRRITGRYYYFDGALPYQAQIAKDQPDYVGYNPAISGLQLNYNRVNFVWARGDGGWSVQMNAEGTRFIPKVTVADVQVVAREAPLFVYEADAPVERWTVAQSGLGKGGSRWLPLRHPAPYAAQVFATLCAAQGVKLPQAEALAKLPPEAQVMAQDRSPPLGDVLQKMLKYSTNITAEAIGLAASGADSPAKSARMMTDWAAAQFGISAVFADHSGLGPGTRCSALDMVAILRGARADPKGRLLAELLREKPVGDSKLRVHAKSGTLNFVSALAGYLGADVIFAIFSADLPRRNALPLADREDPPGGQSWLRRARGLQKALLASWAGL